jgi:LemA protein
MFFFVILGIVALAVIWGISIYNRLVKLRNTTQSSWSDIDVLLKKRYNLVDNLVETVKGYATHEKGTLTGVTEARSRAMQAQGPEEKARAENIFKDTLKSLFAVAEAYPDLKANQNFLELQGQLMELENGIEYARRYYNAVVRDFNTLQETFPANVVAKQYAFTRAQFFELAGAEEREPVKVKFS